MKVWIILINIDWESENIKYSWRGWGWWQYLHRTELRGAAVVTFSCGSLSGLVILASVEFNIRAGLDFPPCQSNRSVCTLVTPPQSPQSPTSRNLSASETSRSAIEMFWDLSSLLSPEYSPHWTSQLTSYLSGHNVSSQPAILGLHIGYIHH